ncbi:hypothetical protein [Yoonia maricola]|nr:hypothetical protein [Yoonia maricola]
MKWMVDARNKIEKRGDLETHSDVTVSILASYLDHERVSVQVETDLFDSTQQLMEKIPKYALRKHVLRDGILQIQRRWVANDLPEYELLDAVAEAYGHLSRLVHDAHLALGLLAPDITSNVHGLTYDHEAMDGKLPCMIGHERRRSCDIWLATGERMEIETKLVTVSRAEAEKVSGRYDIDFSEVYSGANTPEETLRKLFDVARKMFLNDEYHATIAILLKGIIPVDIQELRPEEHGQKYVMAQMLADQVRRVGADTVIVIGEIWTAPFDPEQPLARAVDSSDKSEALSGTLVQKRGEPLRISAEILRGVDRVALKASTEQSGGAHNFFSPIYDVWGRAKSPSAEEAQHDK